MQIADVYIASRTLDLAAENVGWRLDQGIDVSDDLAVAAYWTCTEGPSALRTCHHLHGGMGVDETYPLHHYFSWVTDITHALDVRAEAVSVEDPTTKNLELSAGAADRSRPEIRDYFTGLATSTSAARDGADRHGRATSGSSARWATTGGWASAGRRSTAATGSARSSRRSSPTRRSTPTCTSRGHPADGRPDADPYGSEKQKDLFLKRILAGDVHFAIGYSEPDAGTDLASLRTRPGGRRPLRRQRPEAVDDRWPPGRLRLARGPHRPRRAQAQGHLDPDRRHHRPGLLTHADHHRRRLAPRQRDLLQRRPRPRRHAGRRGEPGLEADHHPAQPRAGHARPGRPDRGAARPRRRLGHQGRRGRPPGRGPAARAR